MLGLAWLEASRTQYVAECVEKAGRRRKANNHGSRVASVTTGNKQSGETSNSTTTATSPKCPNLISTTGSALPPSASNNSHSSSSSNTTNTRKSRSKQRRYVQQEWCFAIAVTDQHPRRVVVVNWQNHPILDIVVAGGTTETCTVDSSNNSTANDSNEPTKPKKNGDTRPPCLKFHCDTIGEATDILRVHLFSKPNLILIGHGLERILRDWNLSLSWKQQRCTATYPPYMEERRDPLSTLLVPAKIEHLMQRVLKRRPSVNLFHLAAATLDLYKKAQNYWEEDLYRLLKQKEKSKTAKLRHAQLCVLQVIPEQQHQHQNHYFHQLQQQHPEREEACNSAYPESDQGVRDLCMEIWAKKLNDEYSIASSITADAEDAASFPSTGKKTHDESTATLTKTENESVWETSLLPPSVSSWSSSRSWIGSLEQSQPAEFPELDSTDAVGEGDEQVAFGQLLPLQLLADSSSDDEQDNNKKKKPVTTTTTAIPDAGKNISRTTFKREESSHPVLGDDWLDCDSTLAPAKRKTWFGLLTSSHKEPITTTNENA